MIYYKSLAVLMCVLIVTMPFTYSAIQSVKVTGADGISGIIRQEDTITYTATVDGNVSPELLLLNSQIPFDSCEGSLCTLSQTTDATMQLPVVPWTVALFEVVDNETRQVDSESGIIAVDRTGPEVISFSSEMAKKSVSFSYRVQDYGFARGDTSNCAGLMRIEITDSGGSLSKTIEVPGKECSYSGSTSEARSSFSEGHHAVTITAYDIFEQAGAGRTVEFDIDLTPPSIGESSGALDAYGAAMTFIGPSPQRMRVEVMIEGDDLDAGSVAGDFTSLGFENGNIRGSCSRAGVNGSRCVFFINAYAREGGSFSYTITASDRDGNSATTEGSLDLTFDGTGPVISAINVGVVAPDGFTYLLPGRNDITATVSDEGIGFSKDTIFLDLSGMGLGNKVMPSECTEGTCTWKNIPNTLPSGYLGTVKAGTESKDLLGNLLQLPSITIDVKSDKNAPELISFKATPVGTAFGPAYQGLIKTGDILIVEVKVRERHSSVASAVLDFSSFLDPADTNASSQVTGACSASEAVYTCTFQTPAISLKGHFINTARINITDVAGNSLLYDIPIEVLELELERIDYWKHDVVCSPQPIDRQVTSLTSQRVFCAVTLSPKKDSPRTLFMALDATATAVETNATGDYLESFELINAEENSTDPYIVLTLAKTDFKIDKLKVDAVLQIISQAENKVTGIPEQENVSIELEFYNMPLGELSKNLEDKIDEAVDQAKILGDWVGVLNQILSYGKRLCEIIGTFIKIYGIINAVGIILTTAATPATAWGDALDASRNAMQTSSSGVGDITKLTWGGAGKALGDTGAGGVAKGINLFCKAFSCRLYFDEIGLEGVGKIQRWSTDAINTWQTGFGAASYLGIGGEFGMRALGEEHDADKAQQAIQSGYEKIPPPKSGKLNPQDSLVVSIATLCVPGIIFNLQKLRQVFCVKADCYKNQVPTGTPAKMCQDLQQYQTCKYVTGELTQIIPLAGLFNYILSLVREFISNPLYAVDAIIGVACVPEIHVKYGGYAAGACLIHDLLGLTADVFSDLKGIGEGWKIEGDYCENV